MLKVPAVIKHVQLYDMLARWWEGQGAEEGGAQMNIWTTVPRLTTKVSSLHPLKITCACGGVTGTVVAGMRVGPVRKSDYVSCAHHHGIILC